MLDINKELNDQQRKAVLQIDGPMLILAGAGTGKTKTMTCRAGHMIQNGIAPEHILMLTFTNKAAREMKDRLAKYLSEDEAKKVTASTFHSFCVSLLRHYGNLIGLNPNFTVLSESDDEDVIAIIKSAAERKKYTGKGFPPNGKICSIISTAINKNMKISDVMADGKYANFIEDVIEIGQKAAIYKNENNLVNYDDLLVKVIELFENHPNVTREVAGKYTHIMVDEYQDTNPLQDAILCELFQYTKNIAVVGDDMQSLYAFRGADVDNIITFPDRFDGCEIIKLEENYRSSQEILDLANVIMDCATEGFPKKLFSNKPHSKKPALISVANQHEEAEYVLRVVKRLLEDGESPSEICIVERNSILSAEIEIGLNRINIPFDKYGGMKFVDLSYVRDIIAYLKLMLNPKDEISAFRVLKIHYGIGDVYARQIAEGMKDNGFKQLIDPKFSKRSYGSELQRLYKQLEFCDGMQLVKMVESFINFYYSTKKRNIENMDTDEGNRTELLIGLDVIREELWQLVDLAEKYKKIDELLDDLLLDNTKIDDDKLSNEHVVISTIHSVKGLEYKHVIILDCVDEIFPNAEMVGSKEDNEELRCFYVAVTRAKENLYIICPKAAQRYGKPIAGVPSRYLKNTRGLIRSNDSNFFERFEHKMQHQPYNFYRKNIWD